MTAIKGKRKPQRNVLYLPTEVRVEVEKIAIEISFMDLPLYFQTPVIT